MKTNKKRNWLANSRLKNYFVYKFRETKSRKRQMKFQQFSSVADYVALLF